MSEHDEFQAPLPGMSALRETTPPSSLVPEVMRRIARSRPAPAGPAWWVWLRRPRRLELRLSPLGALTLAGALGALLIVARPGSRPPPAVAAVVTVRFTLVAQGARQVAVAGDFNGWDPTRSLLVDGEGNGTFAGNVSLPVGAHEYMFVVDGQWVTDPAAAERRPDGFGRTNAVLRL
jgi:hypothetical protein